MCRCISVLYSAPKDRQRGDLAAPPQTGPGSPFSRRYERIGAAAHTGSGSPYAGSLEFGEA
eukprot:scaffold4766_cov390-Prasinococcus_capsulatus_cf.AAC.4